MQYQDAACLLDIFSAESPVFPEVICFEVQRKCPPCTLISSPQSVWVPCGFTCSTSALGTGALVRWCSKFWNRSRWYGWRPVFLLPLPAWRELAEQQQQGQNDEVMIKRQRCQEGWRWRPLFSQYPLETAALCTHARCIHSYSGRVQPQPSTPHKGLKLLFFPWLPLGM